MTSLDTADTQATHDTEDLLRMVSSLEESQESPRRDIRITKIPGPSYLIGHLIKAAD